MIDLLRKLNKEQQEAVQYTEGPLLVIAGAGSGKTRVITYRILYLLKEKNILPSNILGVTFTNKAAKEMKERIIRLAGEKIRGLTISTFHSFGVRILREHIHLLGYKNNFNIYDENDRKNVILSIINEMHLDTLIYNKDVILKHISLAKNNNLFARYFDLIEDEGHRIILKDIYNRYEELLKNYNSIDFDGLILLPIKILKKFPAVKSKYHEQYKYILVDEYQDTNNIQYEFIKHLLNKETNICVVGDDDQAIYGFRGSKVEHMLKFEKDFPKTKIITLTKNYRSTATILTAAGAMIKNNKKRHEKVIESTKKAGQKIQIREKMNERDEAEFVTQKILQYRIKHNIPWSDMAVLYRTNFQSRPFEECFRLRDIPYNIIGGMQFYDRKEIKDILAYLKLIANEKDEVSLLRIINYPKRSIGDKAIYYLNQNSGKKKIPLYETLKDVSNIHEIKPSTRAAIGKFAEIIEKYKHQFFHSQRPMYKIAHDLVREINYEDELMEDFPEPHIVRIKMNNISELISGIKSFEDDSLGKGENPNLYNYLNKISLMTKDEDDEEVSKEGKISLMTFHLSKGLEFQLIFLVGIETELLPHLKSVEEGASLDEERRLFYVGITRAKEHLFITYALIRKKFGVDVQRTPSLFIKELPEGLVCFDEEEDTPQQSDEIRKKAFAQMREIIGK